MHKIHKGTGRVDAVSSEAREAALSKMHADGQPDDAVAVFARFYDQLEAGATGLIHEADIEPLRDLPRLADLDVPDDDAVEALRHTVVLKLNGGLATSMGLDRAKSLLPVKDGRSFLDLIVGQVLAVRARYDVALPLLFMNSFRTRHDTLAALEQHPGLAVDGLPLDFQQNREPKLRADDLSPIEWPDDPELEWCPPGHADLYPALRSSGVLDALLERGYRYAFCSNADNLGAVVEPRIAGWLAAHEIPFALESTRRTPADRKGGHLAVRRRDGRLLLRETAQTSPEDIEGMQDLDLHRYCNTNNVWFDLRALAAALAENDGALDLPLIRNEKTVDPADKSTPAVIQIESAMGAAVQAFAGGATVLVERERFAPVKTTDDLLVVRSDRYRATDDSRLVPTTDGSIYVELDPDYFRVLADFDERFPAGAPSLRECERLVVHGDVHFGADVVVRGDVTISADDGPLHIADDTELA
jgi:UTP--glucose-1-phosphate uridylyltransferase